MTDAELRDLALAELKQTTVGYLNHNWTTPPLGSHWQKGIDYLNQIGVVVEPPPTPSPAAFIKGIAAGWGPDTPSAFSDADLAKYMDLLKANNCMEVRMDYASAGNAQFNRAAKAAFAAGISALPVFTHVDSTAAEIQGRVDRVIADFPKIKRIEIGNEVNGQWAWGSSPNPAKYVEMLKAAYTKAAGRVEVWFSGLAQYAKSDTAHMQSQTFYQQAHDAGAVNYCDKVCWHPYGDGSDGWGLNDWIHNLFNKPLVITETGQATHSSTWSGGVTLTTQAQTVTRRFQNARNAGYIAGVYWYDFRDRGTYSTSDQGNFGLILADSAWTPKQSLGAYSIA
jgi:hypothetical protein